ALPSDCTSEMTVESPRLETAAWDDLFSGNVCGEVDAPCISGSDAERLALLLEEHRDVSTQLWDVRESLVEKALGLHDDLVSDGQAVRDTVKALQAAQKALELEIGVLDWSLEATDASLHHSSVEFPSGRVGCCVDGEALKGLDDRDAAASNEVLQTRVVPNYIVARDIHLWDPSIRAELSSLIDEKKALFRFCIAFSSYRRFILGLTDIKTAFLNARLLPRDRQQAEQVAAEVSGTSVQEELQCNQHGLPKILEDRSEIIAVRPPTFLQQRGYATSSEAWLVLKALYGLDQSPRDWGLIRDSQLRHLKIVVGGKTLRLWRSASDSQLWLLSEQEPCLGLSPFPEDASSIEGWVIIYVDDVLVGACSEVVKAVLAAFSELWQCDEPQLLQTAACKPLRFLGMDISITKRGAFRLTQAAYIQDLAGRYQQYLKRVDCPLPVGTVAPEPEEYNADDLRSVQQAVGELLWVSMRTRMDVSFPVS
ncbi:RE2, partial [Symbiodinium necroappetens]